MKCANPECASEKVFSGGYCVACYTRMRRRGTVARKNVVNRGSCTVAGCDRSAFSKNLCSMHYQQARQAENPMMATWYRVRTVKGDYPPEWDRLHAFRKAVLTAIGERPTPSHQFRRPDPEAPWSVENMVWREPIGISFRDDAAAYQWRWHLRNKYGLTEEELASIVASQGGLCPICTDPLDMLDAKGAPLKVCVDHDHVNKKARKEAVRGVVHDLCNKGMGQLRDQAANCRRAADYLDAHDRRKAAGLTIIDEITAEREICPT